MLRSVLIGLRQPFTCIVPAIRIEAHVTGKHNILKFVLFVAGQKVGKSATVWPPAPHLWQNSIVLWHWQCWDRPNKTRYDTNMSWKTLISAHNAEYDMFIVCSFLGQVTLPDHGYNKGDHSCTPAHRTLSWIKIQNIRNLFKLHQRKELAL